MPLTTVRVLNYQIARVSLLEATQWCLEDIKDQTPHLLVTINPEIIIQAKRKTDLEHALQQADLTVADGIGVVWAARQFGHALPERVPGVELTTKILEQGGNTLRVFFLGSKPGTAEKAALEAQKRYGTRIAGVHHGYFDKEKDAESICQEVRESKANLLLAGLGEGQELFLHTHRQAFQIPLMIGVGGTLDVLSGEVQRTPMWTRQVGLEWAYRVGLDRKRWHRFPRLLQFVQLVLREKRNTSQPIS